MTDTTLALDDRPVETATPGPLGRLARVAFRRRGRVVLAWVAALVVAMGLSAAFAGDFAADYSAPGSDSQQAQNLLEDRFPAVSPAADGRTGSRALRELRCEIKVGFAAY